MDAFINISIIALYVLVVAGVFAMLAFAIIKMIESPKNAVATLAGVGVIVVVFLVSFLFSEGQVSEKYNVSAGQSRAVGASLLSFYFITLGAIALALFFAVKKLLNK